MTDKHVQTEAPHSNMEKDPSTWVTGDEPMTGAQMSYLKTLSEEAKVEFDESLNKAQASERIDELQQQTGRGKPAGGGSAQPARHESPAAQKQEPAHEDLLSEAGEEDPGAAEGDPELARAMRGEKANSRT